MYVVVPYSNPWEHVVDMQGCESVCVSGRKSERKGTVCLGRKRALSLSGPAPAAYCDAFERRGFEQQRVERQEGGRKRRRGLRDDGAAAGGGGGRGRRSVDVNAGVGRRRRGRRGSVVCSAAVVADKRLRRLVEEDAIPLYDRAVFGEGGRGWGEREWGEEEDEDEDEGGEVVVMSGLGEREWRRSEEPSVL